MKLSILRQKFLVAVVTIFTGIMAMTSISVNASTKPTNVYRYCPTSIDDKILYCSNEATPGKVMDGICLNGKCVLTTTPLSWDSAQVCDPTVVSGNFLYKKKSYKYLMAYLGCATYDCTNNEIGFAVSNDLKKWTKTGKAISAQFDGAWGVGQPSLINLNNNIFLFYTSGTKQKTTSFVWLLDCSNLEDIKYLDTKEIKTNFDFISNADFAYTQEGLLLMTCDTHPFEKGSLNYISQAQTIYALNWDGTLDTIKQENWQKLGTIDYKTTGHKRNHNACFIRDGSGKLIDQAILLSTADEVGSFTDNLFTYDFERVKF